jgi:hypothetical protein
MTRYDHLLREKIDLLKTAVHLSREELTPAEFLANELAIERLLEKVRCLQVLMREEEESRATGAYLPATPLIPSHASHR